eukprot:4221574-Pleurochrysis_carterae.AAC.1
MLVGVLDSGGKTHSFTLCKVRCIPSFADSLLSVSQLLESSATECRFGGVQAMLTPPCKDGKRTSLPFGRLGGLYVWKVVLGNSACSSPPARAMAIHASRS